MYEHQIIPSMINSARKYYDYLCRTDKGNEVISLAKIVKISDFELKLYLAKKLYKPDEFYLKVNNQMYFYEELRVNNYDPDLKTLTITPKEHIRNDIANTNIDKIHLVSDLKFLVKRVIGWYEWCKKNNYSIELQKLNRFCKISSVSSQPQIDECQRNAINTTLSAPLSYVWGAPGTGKTRYVLSNSVLSHIKANERVLVVAPTNNSLEQSLCGIIEVLESQGVKREDILRLGTPTYKFATAYPECCEREGLSKNISELQSIISSLKERKKTIMFYERYYTLSYKIIPAVKELSERIDYFDYIKNQINIKSEKIKHIGLLLHKENQQETELAQKIKALEKKSKSISAKLFKNKKQEIDSKLSELYHKLKECIESQQSSIQFLKALKDEISKLNAQLDYNDIKKRITKIKEESQVSQQVFEIVIHLSDSNCRKVLDMLKVLEQQGKNKLDEIKFDDFDTALEDIQHQINEHIFKLEILQTYTTEERLKNVKVIATTIDGFTSKSDLVSFAQADSKYKIHHVYLDEAGYCSLIKGLTLFACNVPITFLGDHMQLPPVCEMNDDEFEKDDNFPIFLWAQSALAVEDIFNYSLEDAFLRYKEAEDFEFKYISKTDLTVTYRFGAALSRILDSFVYKNGFKSADSIDELIIKVVKAPKTHGYKKRENLSEVNKIKHLLEQYEDKDYAILTPYRNQLKLLNQELPKARREQRIMTVHASQGREFDTIILSVVDSRNMYFTDTTNKLSRGLQIINTAVSRAKKELILVCDAEYWSEQNHQLIADIISVANK